MAVNIAINGFGRIGRLIFCQLFGDRAFEITAVNDSAKPELLAWLLKYETPQGGRAFGDTVNSGPGFISLKGKNIKIYAETDLSKLPWKKLKVDLVIDCSGQAASKDQAAAHLAAGAKKVLLVLPSSAYPGIDTDIPVIVYGINEKIITHTNRIIAAPSSVLSSITSLVKALNDFAPIRSGILAITGGEAAGADSGAAIAAAISHIIPELQGKLTGIGGITEAEYHIAGDAVLLTTVLKGKNITAEALNKALKAKIDPARTLALPADEDLYQVQITAGYENEVSYAIQLVKSLKYFAELKVGPAKPADRAAIKDRAPKPAADSKTPTTGAVKNGAAKKGGQKPVGSAKPAVPTLSRKPLINFPK
ncbi:glyceraldehyde-3-phosphate dehydrogenase [Spirochaetia bacterium]|nr:glyceraldehyde-3-phosphate dehydrogenase [Spirochaetia bacterium]